MNPVDPKWMDILKASGWQTSALAVACGIIILLVNTEIIPTDGSPYWIAIPAVGCIVFGLLSLAAFGRELAKIYKPAFVFHQWRIRRSEQSKVRQFIPYMSEKDREIIGYLLYHNQKVFQAEQDGGHAAPLISKGIIRTSAVHGQVLDLTRVPFEVPDHVWSILEEYRDKFPYAPPSDEVERHPWAIHWMARI